MQKRFSRAAVLFILTCFTCLVLPAGAAEANNRLPPPPEGTIDFWSDMPDEELAEELVSRMTDDELLAQILMFGWAGAEPSPLVTAWVEERHLGSVKIFGWNTDNLKQVADSVAYLQKKALKGRFRIPLFVATDQEGGWIRHIKGETSDTPGNLAIGASGLPIDSYNSGYYIANELRALGINMNFAPTVDLYTNYDSTVIGPRSFGEDPNAAGVLGASFAAGMMAAGVIPTAKHFPGHGDTGVDSHGGLPVIDIDVQTLESRELIPFKYLIAEGIPAIMSGHLSFPRIAGKEPASLSKTFLTDMLRKKLGFDGLIITDDMMMNGATMYAGSLSQAVRMAIQAGNDIIISSTTPSLNEALWKNNLALMKSDAAFRQTVRDSARRVLLFKLRFLKSDNAPPLFPDPAAALATIPAPGASPFFLEQACRSITLHKAGTLPLSNGAADRILIAGQFPSFIAEGKKRFPKADTFEFSYLPGPNETAWTADRLARTARNYDTVIFCLANQESFSILKKLEETNVRVAVVSALSPVFALDLTQPDTIILCYSYSPYSFTAAFAVLAGDFIPEGRLPLMVKQND